MAAGAGRGGPAEQCLAVTGNGPETGDLARRGERQGTDLGRRGRNTGAVDSGDLEVIGRAIGEGRPA